MIGPRVGLRAGPKAGPAAGPGADEIGSSGTDPMAGVTRDATSSIYCPATLAEWATTRSAAGVPAGAALAIWGFQESATPVADASGNGITLTVSGSPTFQAVVSGWTRLAITYADAATGSILSGNAALPDISTTSFLVIGYIKFPAAAPAAARNLLEVGTAGANRGAAEALNTSVARAISAGNTANGASNPFTGAVRPVVVRVNRTASTFAAMTDQDKMAPTFGAAMTGKAVNFNAVAAGNTSIAGGELYGAAFSGAAAELTDAQVKAVLQTLGWSIAWS